MIETTLDRIAAALERIAARLDDGTLPPAANDAPAAPEPAPAAPAPASKEITLDGLRARFQALSERGQRAKLLDLLTECGVQRLPDLDTKWYATLDAALAELEAA
jgi:hypothetical protein